MRITPRVPIILALGLALMLVLSCEHDPVGVDAFSAAPCRMPPLPASLEGLATDPGAVGEALTDAATRSSAGLASGSHTDELVQALDQLARQVQQGPSDAGCRMLLLATDALARQNATEEQPDRAAIQLVLDLANAALRPR